MIEPRTITFVALPFKPIDGEMVYVEGSFDERVNGIVARHWRELDAEMYRHWRIHFCYVPTIHERVSEEQLQWINPVRHGCPMPPLHPLRTAQLMRHLSPQCDRASLRPGMMSWISKENFAYFEWPELDEATFIERVVEEYRQYVERPLEHYGDEIEVGMSSGFIRPSMYARFMADETFRKDVLKLMEEVRQKVEQLRCHGLSEMAIKQLIQPDNRPSRMVITADWRIILPDYGDMEIEMRPLVKAVYFLFLRHPEGIFFKDLFDHYAELAWIYQTLRGGDELTDKARQSISDIANPFHNSINEKCARVREAFLAKMNDALTAQYMIDGERACAKAILLPRELVTWECEIPPRPVIEYDSDDPNSPHYF